MTPLYPDGVYAPLPRFSKKTQTNIAPSATRNIASARCSRGALIVSVASVPKVSPSSPWSRDPWPRYYSRRMCAGVGRAGLLLVLAGRDGIRRQRRHARRRHAVVRGLLEGVRVADEPGLAERRAREGHAEGRGPGVEARRKVRRRIGEEPAGHDHARVARAGRRVVAEVGREKDRVELLPGAAPLIGHEPHALLRDHAGVEDVQAAGPGQFQI